MCNHFVAYFHHYYIDTYKRWLWDNYVGIFVTKTWPTYLDAILNSLPAKCALWIWSYRPRTKSVYFWWTISAHCTTLPECKQDIIMLDNTKTFYNRTFYSLIVSAKILYVNIPLYTTKSSKQEIFTDIWFNMTHSWFQIFSNLP